MYADIDINQRCFGNVVRMEEHVPARKVFEGVVPGKRRRGAARLRWKDQVLADLSRPGHIPDCREDALRTEAPNHRIEKCPNK